MSQQLTWSDVRACLTELFPSAPIAEVDKATTVMVVMLKVAGAAPPTKKAAPKKQRQYKEKSVAESQKLKR